MIWEPWQRMKK